MENQSQPQTRIVQYRQITGVHLKSGIEDEDFEEDRTYFGMDQDHVVNIEVEADTVLVAFDNNEGYAIPASEVHYSDYEIIEEEVPVQRRNNQQPRQPQGQAHPQGTRNPQGKGGTQQR